VTRLALLRKLLTVLLSLVLAVAGLLTLGRSETGASLRAFLESRKKVLVQETPDFDPR
jgi:branched-subunit amino acid ABC-type transport system permease component